MIPKSLAFWDQLQLILLRFLSTILGVVDALFNVHWSERVLDRLTNRWQAQVAQLNQELARLEQERERLYAQAEALAIHAAAIYLGSRMLARNELRFDPSEPHDEEPLNASIELLVKQRLAAIEAKEDESGHYVYFLEPDWQAIRTCLADALDQATPEIADWFREGLRFIDEAFLSGTTP